MGQAIHSVSRGKGDAVGVLALHSSAILKQLEGKPTVRRSLFDVFSRSARRAGPVSAIGG